MAKISQIESTLERPNDFGVLFRELIPPWEVEVWLNADAGETVISELSIRPPDRGGVREIPVGGLSSQLVQLNVSTLKAEAIKAAREITAKGNAPPGFRLPEYEFPFDRITRWIQRADLLRNTLRRTDRNALWLAAFAARYVMLSAESRSVVPKLAETYGYAQETVRDIIKQCRAEDLLTAPSTPGRAGGQLTEKAKRILAGEDV